MIKIQIIKDCEGNITQISGKGHAEHGKHGEDIVCAAVSILFQSSLIGLEEVVKAEVEYEMKEAYMLIRPNITKEKKELINALLDTLELSLENILLEYPKNLKIIRGGASNDKN